MRKFLQGHIIHVGFHIFVNFISSMAMNLLLKEITLITETNVNLMCVSCYFPIRYTVVYNYFKPIIFPNIDETVVSAVT